MILRVLVIGLAIFIAGLSPALAQFNSSNCTQSGGYPWVQSGCLNASDLNNAMELSIGGSPPQNVSGQGASQGKLWLDTSRSPAQLRQCAVQVPSRCSTNYVATEWLEWEAVDFAGSTVDWPIGGGVTSVAATAVLDIGLYPQATLRITGTANINSFGASLPAGQAKILLFDGASTIIYGAGSIITPTGANITTVAGGIAIVVAQGGGVYRLVYQPQAGGTGGGGAPGGATNAFQYNGGGGAFGGTPVVNNAVACTNASGAPGECTTLPSGLIFPSPSITGILSGGTLQPGVALGLLYGGTGATSQAAAQASLGIGSLGLLSVPAATPLLGSNGTGLTSVTPGNNLALATGVLNVTAGGVAKALQIAASGGGLSGSNVLANAVAVTDSSGNALEATTLPSGIALPSPLISGLSNPTTSDQPANKGYVDATASGFSPHTAVAAATAAALPNSPTYNNASSGVGATLTAGANAALVIDGVTISTLGTRVLVQNQASAFQNGLYTLTTAGSGSVPWVLTRATDFDQAVAGEVAFGANVFVAAGGTVNGSTSWTMNTTGAITIGTTALNWVQSSGSTSYQADNTSLQLSGNTFAVKPGGTFPSGLTIPGYLIGNQTITISGDATGSGATSIPLTLANTSVTPGTYTPPGSISVDSKGRLTGITALGYTPLNPANNLSDVGSPATARTNLGLGSIATLGIPAASNLLGSTGTSFAPVAVSGPGLSLSAGTLTAVPYTADGTTLALTGRQFGVTPGGIGNTQLASMAAHTYKGNAGSLAAAPSDLTQAQLTAELNPCTASLKGMVPTPPGDPTQWLNGNCTWSTSVIPTASNLVGSSGTSFTPVAVGGPGLSLSAGTLTAVPYTADGTTLTLSGRQFGVTPGGIGNTQMASMAAHTYKGNVGTVLAAPSDLTQTQLTGELNPCTASLKGMVPTPPGDPTKSLNGNCAWASVAMPVNCPSILLYGGNGNGSTDNSAALSAALAAATSGGQQCVSFPPGQFLFSSPFSYTFPNTFFASISLVGSGSGVTQILGPANASLFAFTKKQFNSFHLRGMSLITNYACSACTAISLIEGDSFSVAGYSAQNDFTDINITGSDPSDNIPSGTTYWETGINIFGVSNINFTNVYIQGIQNSSGPTPGTSRGIVVAGDSSHVPVVFNLVGVSINLYNRAFEYGPWTQGVTITASNLIGNAYGVYVSSLVNQLAGQLSIANSSANNCSNVFVANQVPGQVAITGIQITNNTLISAGQPWPCPGTTSILLGDSSTYSFVANNDFGGASSYTGVNFAGPSYTAGKVVHNMFNGFGVAIDTTPNPAATATGGLIDGNTITNNGIGIRIGANTLDFVVSNNILQGNTTDLQNNTGNVFTNYIDIPQDCSTVAGVGFGFGGASTGMTYSNQSCQYSVVGREGFLDIDYALSSKGSATGNATFQMPGVDNALLPGGAGFIAFAGNVVGLFGPMTAPVNQGSSTLLFYQWTPPGGTIPVTDANFQNNTRIKARVEMRVPSVYP